MTIEELNAILNKFKARTCTSYNKFLHLRISINKTIDYV